MVPVSRLVLNCVRESISVTWQFVAEIMPTCGCPHFSQGNFGWPVMDITESSAGCALSAACGGSTPGSGSCGHCTISTKKKMARQSGNWQWHPGPWGATKMLAGQSRNMQKQCPSDGRKEKARCPVTARMNRADDGLGPHRNQRFNRWVGH